MGRHRQRRQRQPQLPPAANGGNQQYVYDTEFTLPACFTKANLKGTMLADNAAAAYLNGSLIGYQSSLNGGGSANFTTPTAFSTAAGFQAGTNVVDFLVEDHTPPSTGLDFSATVTYVGGQCGVLKICKVAGFGIAVGTPFTFKYATVSGSGTVTVPAGPAPGGYCEIAATSVAGAYTVGEAIPAGDTVRSITPVPSGGTANLVKGTDKGTLTANQVSEVTYVDQDLPKGMQTGYLEICKSAPQSSTGAVTDFTFTVDGRTVTVPAGACSPAIEVAAGTVIVTETPQPPYVMVGCATMTTSDLLGCDPAAATATVAVAPGGVPDETILTVTNALPPGT